ncbi:MAG: hypothetical protein U1F67_13850 [Rubrivivax sp.]
MTPTSTPNDNAFRSPLRRAARWLGLAALAFASLASLVGSGGGGGGATGGPRPAAHGPR